jgi:hypothetical protein
MNYRCPVCTTDDPDWYLCCNNPACPDGRDQPFEKIVGLPTGQRQPEQRRPPLLFWVFILVAVTLAYFTGRAHAHDHDPVVSRWMQALIRPDRPPNPCCGLGDGYPVERYRKLPSGDYEVWLENGDEMTFEEDGETRVRPAWDTTVPLIVPSNKINPEEDDLDNPTDTSWVFFRPSGPNPADANYYCFVRHPKGG